MLDGLNDSAADVRNDDMSDFDVERGYVENMKLREAFEQERLRLQEGEGEATARAMRAHGIGTDEDIAAVSGRGMNADVVASAAAAEAKVAAIADAEAAAIAAAALQAARPSEPEAVSKDQFSLADAEAEMRRAVKSSGGSDFMYRARTTFMQTDRRHTGRLPIEQFSYLLNTLTNDMLAPGFVGTLARFFAGSSAVASSEGASSAGDVNYSAFLKMCSFESKALPSIIAELGEVVLTSNTKKYFEEFLDSRRAGVVDTAAFMSTVRGLLGRSLRRDEEIAVMNIFAGPVSGFIDYPNFIATMEATQAYKTFRAAEEDFLLALTKGDELTQPRIRFWFNRLAGKGESSFGLKELQKAMQLLGVGASADTTLYLLLSMAAPCLPNLAERTHKVVSIAEFDDWVTSMRDPTPSPTVAVTPVALRRKALACFSHTCAEEGFSYDHLLECFHVYDWESPPTGFLAPAQFHAASKKAGFLLSQAEMNFMAYKFRAADSLELAARAQGAAVEYNEFLAFASPPEIMNNGAGLSSVGAVAATLIKEQLLAAMSAGADVLSAMRNMDVVGTGLITPQEFCEACSSLPNVSSITSDEATAVAALVDAVSDGSLVLYRKFVHALLLEEEEAANAGETDPLKSLDVALGEAGISLRRFREVLEYYDRKQNGSVPQEDFPTVLEEVGVVMKRQEVAALSAQYTVEGSGCVLYRGVLSNLDARRASNDEMEASTGAELVLMPKDLVVRLTSDLNQLVERGVDFRGELDALDPTSSGTIGVHEVERALCETLGLPLSKEDVAVILKCYSTTDTSTRIAQKRFGHIKFIRDHHLPLRPSQSEESDHTAAARMADELRVKVFARYGRKELQRPFRHFARRRGEAAANMSDLSIGLADLGIEPSRKELEALYRLMVPVARSTVSGRDGARFMDFVVFVCDPYYLDVEEKFRRQWSSLEGGINGLIASLNMKDVNSSGIVTMMQFDQALGASGLQLSPSDSARLAMRFDTDSDGRIDIERFFGHLRMLAATGGVGGLAGDESSPDEIAVARTLAALKRRVEGMLDDGRSESAIMDLFDIEHGQLDLRLLQLGARRLGEEMSREVARSLLRKLCLNVRGLCDSTNLFQALGVDLGASESSSSNANASPLSIEAIFRRRPDLLAGLVEAMTPLQADGFTLDVLQRELVAADQYDLGQVERVEFTLCLRRVGIELRGDHEKELAEVLGECASSVRGSGAGIDYVGFVNCMRGFYKGKLGVNEMFQELERAVSRAVVAGKSVERVFDEMDRDGDGELGVADMTRQLDAMHFVDVGRTQVLEVMQRISPAVGVRRTAILYVEFERHFEGLDMATPTALARTGAGFVAEEDPITALKQRLRAEVASLQPRQRERYTAVLNKPTMTFHDLSLALESLGLNIEQSEVDVLFDELAGPGGGSTIRGSTVLDFLGVASRR
jgi:Ca2+-binding EF-hand superfamily protein